MVMSTALGPIVTSAVTSTADGIAAALSTTSVGTKLIVAGKTVIDSASAVTAAGAVFKVGGAAATAIPEFSTLAASGTYALGMGGVSAGIVSMGGAVASTLGVITGGAAVATGAITTGISTAASAIFCPPVAIGLGLYGLWRFLRD